MQFLAVIRGHLAHTLRIADVREELLATLAAVADFAYGWGLLDTYVARLQAEVCSCCSLCTGFCDRATCPSRSPIAVHLLDGASGCQGGICPASSKEQLQNFPFTLTV